MPANKPPFLKKELRPGMPISTAGLAEAVSAMDRAWHRLSVHGGRVDWFAGEPKIIFENSDGTAGAEIIKVEYFENGGFDEDTGLILGKHIILYRPNEVEPPTWVDGPLPPALIYPHPLYATDIIRYQDVSRIAAALVGHVYGVGAVPPTYQEYWIALHTFDTDMTPDSADVLIDDGLDGPTLAIGGLAGAETIALTFRKRLLSVLEDDVALGTHQSMAALTIAIGDLLTTDAANTEIQAVIDSWWTGAEPGDNTHEEVMAASLAVSGLTSETVAGHDGRYWPHQGVLAGDPELKNYATVGNVNTGPLKSMIDCGFYAESTWATLLVSISSAGAGLDSWGLLKILGTTTDKIEATSKDIQLMVGTDVKAKLEQTKLSFDTDQVLTTRRTMDAYTADDESAAYTAQSTEDVAKLADLNALREAYENLRAYVEDLRKNVILPTDGHGLAEESAP